MTTVFHRCRSGLAGIVVAVLCACGGGGGGGGGNGVGVPPADAPAIFATVLSLPPNGSILKPQEVTTNTAVAVSVYDNTTGVSITTATVTTNGTSLSYYASVEAYEGQITVSPGANVTVTVEVNGHTYRATEKQVSAFPTVIAPTPGTTWDAQSANLVSWSAIAPSSTAQYISGVFDSDGNLLWPQGGRVQYFPTSQLSYTIPENTLSTGQRSVIVGVLDIHPISGAAPDSQFGIGGFDLVPIVIEGFSGSAYYLTIAPVSAAVAPGGSLQLTATASFTGGTHDVTLPAMWTSSDSSIVTVDSMGVAHGHAQGTAQVTATYSTLFAHANLTVFQPDPSPPLPLSQATAWQIDYAHSGRATVGAGGPVFPPTGGWSVTLNGRVSYPVIAEGKVFVTTNMNPINAGDYGASLYALDLSSGSIAWGPILLPGPYWSSGHAYDHGRVYAMNYDGWAQAYDPASGTIFWSKHLIGSGFNTPPTAANGIVYFPTYSGVLAVDERNGAELWRALLTGAEGSSPAIASDGVFVTFTCDSYRLDPFSGLPLWHFASGCFGGNGTPPVLAGGRLYFRDPQTTANRVFEAATGNVLGTFNAFTSPVVTDQSLFLLSADAADHRVLTATNPTTGATQWSLADDHLASPPIVIDNVLVIATDTGAVYAINASSGALLWTGSTAASFVRSDGPGSTTPLTGLGAGEGYLVVPTDNVLNAWKIVH